MDDGMVDNLVIVAAEINGHAALGCDDFFVAKPYERILQIISLLAGGALKVEKISSKTTCPLSISTQRETQTPLLGEAAGAEQ